MRRIRLSSWTAVLASGAGVLGCNAIFGIDLGKPQSFGECTGDCAGAGAVGAQSGASGAADAGDAGESSGGGSGEAGDAGAGGTTGVVVDCPDLDLNTIPDCTETLAQNSTFDHTLLGWKAEANGALSWDSSDGAANPDSGSIVIENRASTNSMSNGLVFSGATQCIPISAERAYTIFAQMYSSSPHVAGYGAVVGRVFGSSDCSGSPMRVEPSTNSGTVSLWITLQVVVPAPAGAHSLLVELNIGKPTTVTGPVSLNFDNVLVR